MAVTVRLTRRLIDEEPSGNSPVIVRGPELEAECDQVGVDLIIEQDSDKIYLSFEHARAVHAALGAAITDAVGS